MRYLSTWNSSLDILVGIPITIDDANEHKGISSKLCELELPLIAASRKNIHSRLVEMVYFDRVVNGGGLERSIIAKLLGALHTQYESSDTTRVREKNRERKREASRVEKQI